MAEGQAAPPAAGSDALAAPASIVARIDAMLAKEKAPVQAQQQPEQQPNTEQPADEPDAPAGPNRGVEGENQPAADETSGTQQQTAEIPLDQLEAIELEVTTKGEDGKDVSTKLPIKELRSGYMRQADYSRKTAELARQRDEVSEKTRQAIETERTQYLQQLQQTHDLLFETAAPELKDVNWNHLATNDAFEYVRLRNRADQITQALSSIQAKQKEVAAKQSQEQTALRQKAVTQARATLEADIPGFNDALYQSLMKAGEKFGYKPEEIGNWIDPRAIKLLHAATQGQPAIPAKPSADKKIVTVPKTLKSGASAENSLGQQRQADAMKRLEKSGSIQDAAAVLRARLGDSLNRG